MNVINEWEGLSEECELRREMSKLLYSCQAGVQAMPIANCQLPIAKCQMLSESPVGFIGEGRSWSKHDGWMDGWMDGLIDCMLELDCT